MDDAALREVVRHTMAAKYNDWSSKKKKFLPTRVSEAMEQIEQAKDSIALLQQQIEDAELAIGILTLGEQYGLMLWDLSDYLPKDQWTFVGTDAEFAAKARSLGMPEDHIQDQIKYKKRA